MYWSSATASACDLGAVMPSGHEDRQSRAQAINNGTPRMAVGWDETATTGLLWIENGTGSCPNNWSVVDLNATASSGCWTIHKIHDVNDNGWIVGEALNLQDSNANSHLVLIRYVGPTGCIADIGDGTTCPDGVVDVHDLFILLGSWQEDSEADFTGPEGVPDHDTNVYDLFYLLAHWGPCDNPLGFVPTSVQDCIDMFGLGEENRDKLNACLEAVDLIEGQ